MIARLRPGLCLSLLLALPIAAQTNAPAWSSGEYRYDGAGNIVAIGSAAYGYDAVTRLTRALVAPSTTYEYEYDPYGNRTAYRVNQQRVPIAVSSATNHLTDATYDATGNQLSRGATTATYDGFGMVTSYRFDAVHAETFVYNANDERIGVLRNTDWTWSLRDPGGRVLRQYRSSSTDPAAPWIWGEDFVYRGSLLLGSQRPPSDGGARHYHLDHLGSPRIVTSASGAVVSGHDFLPFGEERTPAAQQAARGFDRESPHRFTAHERDYDTATPNTTSAYIDYMHARYYAAATGRFLSVDPAGSDVRVPQTWNRYTYVLNNPVNATDPTGRCSEPASFIGPPAPCPVTIQPPKNAATWTPEQRALENKMNAEWAAAAEEGGTAVTRGAQRTPGLRGAYEAANGPIDPDQDLGHKRAKIIGGTDEFENLEPQDRMVNRSHGARQGQALRGLSPGTVVTRVNYTIISWAPYASLIVNYFPYANDFQARNGRAPSVNETLHFMSTGDRRSFQEIERDKWSTKGYF